MFMGPFGNEAALHSHLLKPASSHLFASEGKHEETLALAKRIEIQLTMLSSRMVILGNTTFVDEDGILTG